MVMYDHVTCDGGGLDRKGFVGEQSSSEDLLCQQQGTLAQCSLERKNLIDGEKKKQQVPLSPGSRTF